MIQEESYRRILFKLGYYDYQQGFITRHLNQESGWNSHLERCRNFILKAFDIYRPERVTVLGSGWLLEVPLTEMLERGATVSLIDIIHPPEVVQQVSNIKGVQLITEDISGGLIEEIWRHTSRLPLFGKLGSLSGIRVPEYNTDRDPGMVISLNLLTQLETLPIKQLSQRTSAGQYELEQFRKAVQESHLSFLKKQRSVLLTDVAEVFTDKSGAVTEKRTALADLPGGSYREEWTWDFDLKRSDYFTKRSVLKVAAIIL
jgi:hypothetical protein